MNEVYRMMEEIGYDKLPHRGETVTKKYMDVYKDGVQHETISHHRQVSFNNQGQRLYEVSVNGIEFYPIPYGFDVPFKFPGATIYSMITHAKFNQ